MSNRQEMESIKPQFIIRPPDLEGREAYGQFGAKVDMSETAVIVAAPSQTTSDSSVGRVFIYERDADKVELAAHFRAPALPGELSGGGYGFDVAIDGNIAVVSAPWHHTVASQEAGLVFVYERDEAGEWRRQAILSAPQQRGVVGPTRYFGYQVAVSEQTIAVTAFCLRHNSAANYVFVFEKQADNSWGKPAILPQPRRKNIDSERYFNAFSFSIALEKNVLAVSEAVSVNAGSNEWFKLIALLNDLETISGEKLEPGYELSQGERSRMVEELEEKLGLEDAEEDWARVESGNYQVRVFARKVPHLWVEKGVLRSPNPSDSKHRKTSGVTFGARVAISGNTIAVNSLELAVTEHNEPHAIEGRVHLFGPDKVVKTLSYPFFSSLDFEEELATQNSLFSKQTPMGQFFASNFAFHGDRLVVGGNFSLHQDGFGHSAYLYYRDHRRDWKLHKSRLDGFMRLSVWRENAPASASLSLHGDVIALGNTGVDKLGLNYGTLLLYREDNGAWVETEEMKGSVDRSRTLERYTFDSGLAWNGRLQNVLNSVKTTEETAVAMVAEQRAKASSLEDWYELSQINTLRVLLSNLHAFGDQRIRQIFAETFAHKRNNRANGKRTIGTHKMRQTLNNLSTDLEIMQQALDQRRRAPNGGMTTQGSALLNADNLAAQAMQPARGALMSNRYTRIITYFSQTTNVRVLPYDYDVILIGIPFASVSARQDAQLGLSTQVPWDFLALPHEIGHYLYRYGKLRYDPAAVRSRLLDRDAASTGEQVRGEMAIRSALHQNGRQEIQLHDLIPLVLLDKKLTADAGSGEDLPAMGDPYVTAESVPDGEHVDRMEGIAVDAYMRGSVVEQVFGETEPAILEEEAPLDDDEEAGATALDKVEAAENGAYDTSLDAEPSMEDALYDTGPPPDYQEDSNNESRSDEDEQQQETVAETLQELLDNNIPVWLQNWLEELFSDVYGCVVAGPISVLGLQGILADSDPDRLLEDNGHYPIPAIRPFIATQILREITNYLTEPTAYYRGRPVYYDNAPRLLNQNWMALLEDWGIVSKVYGRAFLLNHGDAPDPWGLEPVDLREWVFKVQAKHSGHTHHGHNHEPVIDGEFVELDVLAILEQVQPVVKTMVELLAGIYASPSWYDSRWSNDIKEGLHELEEKLAAGPQMPIEPFDKQPNNYARPFSSQGHTHYEDLLDQYLGKWATEGPEGGFVGKGG